MNQPPSHPRVPQAPLEFPLVSYKANTPRSAAGTPRNAADMPCGKADTLCGAANAIQPPLQLSLHS